MTPLAPTAPPQMPQRSLVGLWAFGLGRWILDLILPPLCLNCTAPVGAAHSLCPACWTHIHFISEPCCACCGAPFPVPMEAGALCGACLANPPPFAAARAVMLYDEASKKIVLRFKHADALTSAPALGRLMFHAGRDFWPDADMLIPVPLHRWRLLKRRYNQAALLAHEIAKLAHKPVNVSALERTRATLAQGHMNAAQRDKNLRGSLRIRHGAETKLKNRTVVLIDDVLTTGATVRECCRVLKRAGVSKIYVLTLARVRLAD